MEPPYGGDVARHGTDGQVLVTTGTGLLDALADEQAADALIASGLGYDDRLDLAIRTSVEQTGQTDDPRREDSATQDPARCGVAR